jgi:fermentation-respiration switch protein FrsA (DUF1100 family)
MLAIWILAAIAAGYIAYLGLLLFFQGRQVYHPESLIGANPSNIGLNFESVSFLTGDGIKLYGWFVASPLARGTLLFCHGNAGNISHRLELIKIFHRLELNLFIFDYRGYGQSQGKPSEEGLYRDAEAAWRYLTIKRLFHPAEIVIYGRSLGGPVAARLTRNHQAAGLILDSTFCSLGSMATERYRYLPLKWLAASRFNTVDYLASLKSPVLIIHSRTDDIIPFRQGQRLFEKALPPTGHT